jgi:hypothetical protein
MPETIEDVEREIAEVKGYIAAIMAIPAETRSKEDKDLLLTYNNLMVELRKKENSLRTVVQGTELLVFLLLALFQLFYLPFPSFVRCLPPSLPW